MGLRSEDFNSKDLACVPKVITVIMYLNQGRELRLRGQTYKMGESMEGGFTLLYKVMAYSSGQTLQDAREEWLGYQGDLMHFTEMCAELNDKEIAMMQANMTLQKINSKKRDVR